MKKPGTIGEGKVRPQVSIHVKLADFLAKLAPAAKFEVVIDSGASVEECVTVLTERLGDKFRRAIMDRSGRLHADIAVILNDRLIPPQKFTEFTIHETGNLSIIPIAGGG